MQPSISVTRRFLFYVLFASLFLLLFTCSDLLRPRSRPLVPQTVLMFVLPNKTSDDSFRARDRTKFPHSDPFPFSSSIVVNDRRGRSEKDIREASSKGCDLDRSLLKHSVEYWLTLDLLASNVPIVARPCTVVRVTNSSSADVFFVPFFSSLSYNRHSKPQGKGKASKNRILQDELVRYLMGREEWHRGGGKDHVIVAHHPNSMLQARRKLGSAMFLLADFGRYPSKIANLKKDIIAPYRHVVRSVGNDSATFDERPILAYFQGAINRKDGGKIRRKLYYLLKDEKDVHFSYGSVRENGIRSSGQGMASSKFCLNIAGDTPSSNRLFDAIVSHCVPIVISDDIELPFEDILDYSDFCIFVRPSDAVKKGFLLDLLRGIKRTEWTKMWERLKQIAHHFEYQYPSKQGDSVQMIWEEVARKIPYVRLSLNKEKRLHRSQFVKQSK
uniref:Exostosin GT47 domain-containing protein n=1 Tax=Musa acuminata subsp. malaccensis TaxID=214687 RepID=A0A804KHG3_MUSAM